MSSQLISTGASQYTQLSTPFLDRHNDHIQLYIKALNDNEFCLTDGGYTIADLMMCGCDITSSPKRCAILTTILNGFGVKQQDEEIYAITNRANFAQKKHSLIQAILSINDMFFLSKPQVASVFMEDVRQFFDANDISYVPDAQFQGRSGLAHVFPYTIPATRERPERFVNAINIVSRDKIDSTLFAWNDIKEFRKPGAHLYVILNDSLKKIKTELKGALSNYGVTPIPWTKRNDYIDALAS